MPPSPFSVVITDRAEADLYEIEAYWFERDEGWRGERYFRDLNSAAASQLSDPSSARRGRFLRDPKNPQARSILAFGTYRIVYEIDETAHRVNVLRFWHSHRDNPSGES